MKKLSIVPLLFGFLVVAPSALAQGSECGVTLTDQGKDVQVVANLCEGMLVPFTKTNGELDVDAKSGRLLAYLGVRGAQRIRVPVSDVNLDQATVEYTYLTSPGTQVKFAKLAGRQYGANFDPAEWDTKGQGAAVGNWQVRLEDGKTVVFFNLAAFQVSRNGAVCGECIVAKPTNFREPGETEQVLAFSFKKKAAQKG